MIPAQLLTGLIFLIIAADFSAIHGGWAAGLGLPLSGLVRHSYWLAPAAALLACVLPRRVPAWLRILGSDVLALCLVLLPVLVLTLGSQAVTVAGALPSGLTSQQLRTELGFPVVIVQDSRGTRVRFPRAHEPALVHEALRRHQALPGA